MNTIENKKELKILADYDLIIDNRIKDNLLKRKIFVDIIDNSIIKFYSKEKLILSKLYPVLDSMGFEVEKQVAFDIDSIYVAKFNLINMDKSRINENSNHIKSVISRVIDGQIPNSCKLLELTYRVNFSIREIELFKALAKYESQLAPEYNFVRIVRLMTRYLCFSKNALAYFKAKFEPSIKKSRAKKISIARDELLGSLRAIENINDDKIAKMLLLILDNIVRTNFYLEKETISFKIETKNIKHLLHGVQPNIEAFVYSKDILGVHLRTGYVCRGGLRWSQRYSDYREEVKSLMRAQEAKNAVIVPNGSKGGFVINNSENITMEKFTKHYSSYIDALLDLVDNEDNSFRDKKIVAYDKRDPYFVVAADKGTASMSDIANSIAVKRGFWLKDAFASGGKNGYHHKKLGITAKGALRSTYRFFIEKGIDFFKEPITVVGVGSLNGDVFGNGMIDSPYFKVLGAISERDIFIDPNPDPLISYEERKRLFNSKNGHWSEYKKFSKGGGVFSRSSKSITLTPEIKELLNYSQDTIDADELAREVLRLKVDMLYHGGIGTYIKSSEESNLEIGDKENEYVRVDANEIRAYSICEGANLAITQKARIEYALNGGKINLDSIDNSAGVDTSDHEVNFKILFNILENRKLLPKGNTLLKDSTEFVVKSVLKTNYLQALAISLDEERSEGNFELFEKVVTILEKEIEIFNKRDFLLKKLERYNNKIIRPILATTLLYSKIFLQQLLLESDMILDKEFDYYLFKYFPKHLVVKFEDKLSLHPLRKEIIATIISNKIINATGSTFIADYDTMGKEKFLKKIKAYLILNRLFDATDARELLFNSDFIISTKYQYQAFLYIENSIGYALNSMVELNNEELNFNTILAFKPTMQTILEKIISNNLIKFDGLDIELNFFLNMIGHIKFIAEVFKIEFSSSHSFHDVMEAFFAIIDELNIANFVRRLESKESNNQNEILIKELTQPNEIVIKKQLDTIVRSITSKATKDLLDFKRKDETIEEALNNYLKEINFDMDYFKSLDYRAKGLSNILIAINYLTVKFSA
jgi:glutamate dehydrogenase